VQFYVCTRCRARYRVGQQYAFVDAESLKQAGCARCGNTRFRYVNRVVPQGTLSRDALTERGAVSGRGVEVEPAWPSRAPRAEQPEPAPASA
jgi:predicted  nucleic acid-binding Zn-ribbon protein